MRRLTALAFAFLLAVPILPSAQSPPAEPAIRLVLLIAVDQLRFDYLTRFRGEFRHGFARLLNDGAVFTNAYHDHYPTVTAIGHATMLSGATPAVSGIIGNDWYDRALGASVTSVEDPNTRTVGGTPGAGASPHRLLVSTVGDELKTVSGPGADRERPRVFGLSLKDRSAILPAGHRANGAFWFDTTTGTFESSTWYGAELPAWVAEFNARKPADAYAGRTWEFAGGPEGKGRMMPAAPGRPLYAAVYGSPFGNELLASLAETALAAERLGQRGVTDLLSVSFSSNDSVGHSYGPDSPEVHDITVRTDEVIGRLLAKVDELVGLDRTLVVLTADHGVSPVPETLAEAKMPGGRMAGEALFGPIEAALDLRFGEGKWILATAGSSPYLNHGLVAERELDAGDVRRVAAAAAAGVPHVARVYTRDQILRGDIPPDTIGRRVLRSYRADRSGDLEIILDPYWIRSGSGTTHGTPYTYDAHVPIVFLGPGIRAGWYHATVAVNDIAPTVATLIGVQIPSGSDGRVLAEMLAPVAVPPAAPHSTAGQ
ncbi:MAG: alkaline phosphatase family protein [Mycobacterium sp.]